MTPINPYHTTNQLTEIIVHEIYKTYFMYGPGLFEKIYETTLAGRLLKPGLIVERQRSVSITNEYSQKDPLFTPTSS